jgi:hypothetical protein
MVSIYWLFNRVHNRVSIDHMRTYRRWCIVISIPIRLGTHDRRLVGGNKQVHQLDYICIEKVGEYILVVQSSPQQGQHRSHAYVPRCWCIVISIPISLGTQERRLVVGGNKVHQHDSICMEKVGEYILVVQSNPQQGRRHWSHAYVPRWLIVISIPISLGTHKRRLVWGNKVHQLDSICIEKVGEYVLVVQSNPEQGGHRSHAYVPRWLIVISIPISLGTHERRLVWGNKVHQLDSICIEKVGEYVLVVQSNPEQGGHRSHAYVPRWLIVISIPISLGTQQKTSSPSWGQQSTSACLILYV